MALKNRVGRLNSQSVFEQYLDDGQQDKWICLVTFVDIEFAGYVTIKWRYDYYGNPRSN